MPVKTYDIEVQRLKSARYDKGVIELGIDALVLPRRDQGKADSVGGLITMDQWGSMVMEGDERA